MMKKTNYFIIFFVISGSLFFLLGPEILPENIKFQELLKSPSQKEIVIIFNSGGWGDTPLEKADDFGPIVKEIQATLSNLGYNSVIIPYQRAKNTLLGRIWAAKETLNSFQQQSKILSGEIEEFLRQNPGKKIILAGLSNGASFVENTMGKIPEDVKNQVYAIEAGTPFWEKKRANLENVLRLDNQGQDFLSAGKVRSLLFSLFRAPLKWFLAKVSDKNLSFSRAFELAGHYYSWPEVKPEIISFLENKLK